MLGETIAAATVAVQSALDDDEALGELLPIAAGGLVIVFAVYWIYFAVPIHEYLVSSRQAFLWGYAHYVILGSAAAIGAGLEIAVEQATHHAHLSARAAALAVTLPTALFMVSVWAVHARHFKRDRVENLVLPVGAVTVMITTLAGHWATPLAGIACAATVAVGITLAARSLPQGGSTGRSAAS
jgi:low temperature requirement protein LtrA